MFNFKNGFLQWHILISIVVMSFVSGCSHLSAHSQSSTPTQTVNSAFGFDITVPEEWLALTADIIRLNKISAEKLNDSRVDKKTLEKVLPAILGGQSEMYFMLNDFSQEANNFVNVISSIGLIPEKDVLEGLCEATEEQLTLAFEKTTKLDSCEYRKLGKVTSIYIEFDGLEEGTKNAQYHAYDVDNDIKDLYIVFSITAQKSHFTDISNALQDSLKTVNWHK